MVNARKKLQRSKICDICGGSGFMECIATCHCCKRAFEHIYCMQVILFKVPDVWYCDGCLPKTRVIHKEKMKVLHTERNSFRAYNSYSKVAISPTKESAQFKDDRTLEEISDDRKQLNRKHVTYSSSRNAFFKGIENAKVKFIPPEEVALSHARTSCRPGNSGESCYQNDHVNAMCHTKSRKALTNMCRSPSLTTTRTTRPLSQPNVAPVNADAGLSVGKVIMARGHVADDKDGNMQQNKISGETCAAFTDVKHMERPTVAAEDYPELKYIQKKETKCVDVGLQHKRKENKKVRTSDCSGGIACYADQCKRPTCKDDDLPLTLLINPNEKLLNCPVPGACWKGAFEVFDVVKHIYDEIQAHFPSQVSPKVYDILKKLPVKLKLNMLPRSDAWPRIFQLVPPTCDDIGLYFFPGQFERPREKYLRLLERIDSRDFAMQAWIGDVELLIYPSKHLTVGSHGIDGQTYLWGTFHHVKNRKHRHHRHHMSSFSHGADPKSNRYAPSTTSFQGSDQAVSMEIDMEGGREIGRVDKPIRKRDAPPGFPLGSQTLHESDPVFVYKPLVKSSLEETSSTHADVPPGFPRTSNINQRRISPVASPEVSQTSATILPLFPQKSEIRKGNVIDDNTRQTISADLSLSRPDYVMDGNDWVPTAIISLDQDGCGEDLKLKL